MHLWAFDTQHLAVVCQLVSRQALLSWGTHQELLQGCIAQALSSHNVPHALLQLTHGCI